MNEPVPQPGFGNRPRCSPTPSVIRRPPGPDPLDAVGGSTASVPPPTRPRRFDALEDDDGGASQVAAEGQLRTTNLALEESRSLVESERARYRDLFELAPDAYLVTDLLGASSARPTTRPPPSSTSASQFLIGKPLFVFLPEESRSAFRSVLNRLRDEVGTREYDLRLQPQRLPPLRRHHSRLRPPRPDDRPARRLAVDGPRRLRPEASRGEDPRASTTQLERRVVERSEMLESMLETNERWLIKVHAADTDARADGDLFRDLVEEVDAILWRVDAADRPPHLRQPEGRRPPRLPRRPMARRTRLLARTSPSRRPRLRHQRLAARTSMKGSTTSSNTASLPSTAERSGFARASGSSRGMMVSRRCSVRADGEHLATQEDRAPALFDEGRTRLPAPRHGLPPRAGRPTVGSPPAWRRSLMRFSPASRPCWVPIKR